MKKLYILAICIISPCLIAAQQTENNKKGDEALHKKDYDDARLYYSEGLADCNTYSIQQLTTIWKENPNLRPSMHNTMNRCLGCLNNKAAAQNDTTAMKLLILYHTEGAGTQKSKDMSNHWENELNNIRNPQQHNNTTITPQKTNPIKYHIGYTTSFHTPFGITITGTKQKYGLYTRIKTNASFQDYETEINLTTDQTGQELPPPFATTNDYLTRQTHQRTLTITTGINIKCNQTLNISLGTGYFKHDKIFQYTKIDDAGNTISNNHYYKIKNHSYQGIAIDTDAIFNINTIYLTIGTTYHIANKQYIDYNIGIGINL